METTNMTTETETMAKKKVDDTFIGDVAESIYRKRKKEPKNQAERRVEALKNIGQGHIANPLGGSDNRRKKMDPKRARAITPDRPVTVPQLYKKLKELYDNGIGPGILENMLPQDPNAMGSMFNDLREKFITNCDGYDPDLRELAEYFEWYFEPARLADVLTAIKYTGKPLQFGQITGGAFVRRFYDKVLRIRKSTGVRPTSSEITEAKDFVNDAFNTFRVSKKDDRQFVKAIVKYGFALAAQYLHDEHGFEDSDCRKCMVAAMAAFIRLVTPTNNAIEYLKLAMETTKENAWCVDKDCIWHDWESRIGDLIPMAIKQAGLEA
jgi:hypothetical protein